MRMHRYRKRLLTAAVLFVGVMLLLGAGCSQCTGYKTVKGGAFLTPTETSFTLRTPGADKDCHAKFRLEVAWADWERNHDPTQPSPYSDSTDMYYDFRASEGSFVIFALPPKLDSTSKQGLGVYYWYWEMDIGARNEANNPTVYEIRCWCNGLSGLQPRPGREDYWHVAVAGIIEYVQYDPPGAP